MNLAELQALFWRSVRVDPAPPEVEAELVGDERLNARQRMAIYRDMYWRRQVGALQQAFEHSFAALGEERFNRLASRYIRRYPSERGALEHLGRHLAEFMAEEGLEADLVDLARLEWALLSALLDPPSPEPIQANALDPALFPTQRLRFTPGLRRLRLDARALRRFAGQEASPSGSSEVIVWRRGFSVHHTSLSPLHAQALDRALLGLDLASVCDLFAEEPYPVPAAFTCLLDWFQRGLVVGLTPALEVTDSP